MHVSKENIQRLPHHVPPPSRLFGLVRLAA